MYNRIVFLMSCADVLASSAMALSTLPLPKTSLVYGARGDEYTCKAQGFFVQFNVTALFYNLMVSTYSFLSVGLGLPERKLRCFQLAMYTGPAVVGLGLAIAAIPYYTAVPYFCYVDAPPVERSWWPLFVFAVGPNVFVSVLATGMMTTVYLKVRKQSRRTTRWSFVGTTSSSSDPPSSSTTTARRRKDTNTVSSLHRQVFWQAVLYLGAFYATYSVHVYLVFHLWAEPRRRETPRNIFPLWVVHLTLTPLQGFWNAFIYYRPRFILWRRRCHQQQRDKTVHAANPLPQQHLHHSIGESSSWTTVHPSKPYDDDGDSFFAHPPRASEESQSHAC